MKHSDPNSPDPNDFDATLDAYFQSARGGVPEVDADFMQRVMDQIPTPPSSIITPSDADTGAGASRSWWKQIFAEIGGWPTVTGLATAGIVGVWIGLTGNSILGLSFDQFQASAEFVDPFLGYDLSYLEG